MASNRRVLLNSRPQGEPTDANFAIDEASIPEPKDGEYLSRTIWLSLDPYMRGRMNDGPSYVGPVAIDAVMCGEVAGEVLESRHPRFEVGDRVAGDLGWQQYAAVDGKALRRLAPGLMLSPISGDDLAQRLGIRHYPVLITATGIEP